MWNYSWVKNLAVSSLYVRRSKTPRQLYPISQVSWAGPTNHKVTKKCLEPWITFSEVAASLFCLIKWIHVLHYVRILKSEGVSSLFLRSFIGFTDKLINCSCWWTGVNQYTLCTIKNGLVEVDSTIQFCTSQLSSRFCLCLICKVTQIKGWCGKIISESMAMYKLNIKKIYYFKINNGQKNTSPILVLWVSSTNS